MTADPVEILLAEHRLIMGLIDPVRPLLAANAPEGAFEGGVPALLAFRGVLGNDIPRHAAKEDDIFFPPIEEVLGRGGGPTYVMRMEHREIHSRATALVAMVLEGEKIAHGGIAAGAETCDALLRRVLAGSAAPGEFLRAARELVDILDMHFAKEEQVLFPMSRQLLSPEVAKAVAAALAG